MPRIRGILTFVNLMLSSNNLPTSPSLQIEPATIAMVLYAISHCLTKMAVCTTWPRIAT
jgi:hypothetical protein